jgi:hypothetical protein
MFYVNTCVIQPVILLYTALCFNSLQHIDNISTQIESHVVVCVDWYCKIVIAFTKISFLDIIHHHNNFYLKRRFGD